MHFLIWAVACCPASTGQAAPAPWPSARDRLVVRWGVGASPIMMPQHQSNSVTRPSAGLSILGVPLLFGPCTTIQALHLSIRLLQALSSRCPSLSSWLLVSQSAEVMSSKFSSTLAACWTLENGRYQNKWAIKALKPYPMRGTSLVVWPSFFNLTQQHINITNMQNVHNMENMWIFDIHADFAGHQLINLSCSS